MVLSIWPQLVTLGRKAFASALKRDGLKFEAPSDILSRDKFGKNAKIHGIKLQVLTTPDIKEYIEDFITAAKNYIEASADGVEIHASNGYLTNQFLDPISNKRTNEYEGFN